MRRKGEEEGEVGKEEEVEGEIVTKNVCRDRVRGKYK